MLSPEKPLRCLFVQPAFSANNYWNYVETARSIGAKTVAPPLGLLTIAALMPRHWECKLVDQNVRDLTDDDLAWADLICTGGMLTQQSGMFDVAARARAAGKLVVIGGADPTSQPDVYRPHADALVLGEGESSVPVWLESWRGGEPCGEFHATERPDVTTSPIPLFELLNFDDYVHVGVQFSRGCPFNCEFCDIIELYGRVPRGKSSQQVLGELDRLYELGYRGWVDVVDDNFIGAKQRIKPLLAELEQWTRERRYPFYFSTEATMNLADDLELLRLMRDCDFRHVFMGIETPEPDLLAVTQKRVNSMRPMVERLQVVYDHGISVAAGFIFGFDGEKSGNDQTMIDFIEQSSIAIAMVGLLVALPNTQLTRRLQKERRLISTDLKHIEEDDAPYRLDTAGKYSDGEDNQATGLNFVTTRDRVEIYREYKRVLETIYSPKGFMDRVLALTERVNAQPKHQQGWRELLRDTRGLFYMMYWMTRRKDVRRWYWRNFWKSLRLGFAKFDFAHTKMAIYLHFAKQSRHVCDQLDVNIDYAINDAQYPRSLQHLKASREAVEV